MKGIYVLTIQINHSNETRIGALGQIAFPSGLYAYVGSAQKNLELRVARHQRKNKPLFWHIDYLLNNKAATLTDVYYMAGQKTVECQIASLIEANGGVPIVGFGCSAATAKATFSTPKAFDF